MKAVQGRQSLLQTKKAFQTGRLFMSAKIFDLLRRLEPFPLENEHI